MTCAHVTARIRANIKCPNVPYLSNLADLAALMLLFSTYWWYFVSARISTT